jgi:hypothetical protein
MLNIAGRLDQQIRDAGVAIVGVSVTDTTDKATWTVQPPELQASAQPVIEAFDIAAEELLSQFADLRVTRNALLVDSDWTHMSDVTISAASLSAWAVYRQALRDLPANTVDPANPVWPTEPA